MLSLLTGEYLSVALALRKEPGFVAPLDPTERNGDRRTRGPCRLVYPAIRIVPARMVCVRLREASAERLGSPNHLLQERLGQMPPEGRNEKPGEQEPPHP